MLAESRFSSHFTQKVPPSMELWIFISIFAAPKQIQFITQKSIQTLTTKQ